MRFVVSRAPVSSHRLRSAFYPQQRIVSDPTLCLYPAAERSHRGEAVVPRRRRNVPPTVLENAAYPLGGEPVEGQVGAEVPTTAPRAGVSCVARWRTGVWRLGTAPQLDRGWGQGVGEPRTRATNPTLLEISDGVHGIGGYPNRLCIRGFTFELLEILRQYLYFGGGPLSTSVLLP